MLMHFKTENSNKISKGYRSCIMQSSSSLCLIKSHPPSRRNWSKANLKWHRYTRSNLLTSDKQLLKTCVQMPTLVLWRDKLSQAGFIATYLVRFKNSKVRIKIPTLTCDKNHWWRQKFWTVSNNWLFVNSESRRRHKNHRFSNAV